MDIIFDALKELENNGHEIEVVVGWKDKYRKKKYLNQLKK